MVATNEGSNPNPNPNLAATTTSDGSDDRELKLAAEKVQLSKYPYSWHQTLTEVFITVPIIKGTKSKGLTVILSPKKIKVSYKGQESILEVCLTRLCNSYTLLDPLHHYIYISNC